MPLRVHRWDLAELILPGRLWRGWLALGDRLNRYKLDIRNASTLEVRSVSLEHEIHQVSEAILDLLSGMT